MITQEDYNFVVAFDNAESKAKETLLQEYRAQCAKTFLNLLGHVSKDQTIQYILIMIDDMLQVVKHIYYIKRFFYKIRLFMLKLFTLIEHEFVYFYFRKTSRALKYSESILFGRRTHYGGLSWTFSTDRTVSLRTWLPALSPRSPAGRMSWWKSAISTFT